jgi:hypothetical protein
MAATRHDFILPIRSEGDLRDFIRVAFGVTLPDVQVCPHHTTPWRAFADAYFARYPVAVWKASRGFGGKTFTLALLGLTEAVTLSADVNVLGGSGEQSKRVLEHTAMFWSHETAPRELLASEAGIRTKIKWGNSMQALMASQASVRGPHPPRLRLDEIDEMDIKILDAAMGQPMSTPDIPAQTVMSSTHQYPNGAMTEILKRASDNGYPVYEWCWKETSAQPNGWLSHDEIERKRTEVTQTMWSVEYDLQEPSPEDRAIMPEKVNAMFDESLGIFEGYPKEYIEIEEPIEGNDYSTGADWARKMDYTVIDTLKINTRPYLLVAYMKVNRLDWPTMVGYLDARNTRFPGKSANDGTGLGDVVNGYLKTQSEGVMMVGRLRKDLLSNCIAAIENGEIKAPLIKRKRDALLYASVDDVYGEGHCPDDLVALAMAYKATGQWYIS